jgi:serine/threonine protein kinase
MEQFISELKIQFFLYNPYITKIYGYLIQNQKIYLIMEYMTDGNLYEKIKKKSPIP